VKSVVVMAAGAALTIVVMTAAAGAAAQPKQGDYVEAKKNGDPKIELTVDSFADVAPTVENRCSPLPAPLVLKVDSKGHFHFKGIVPNSLKKPIHVTISGTFVTKNLATGYAHYWTSSCSAAGFKFRAPYEGDS
jgi:hypothetical protein